MAKRTIAIGATTNQTAILHTIPQAVNQVSDETATQIEAVATQIMEDAQVVAAKIRELAAAIREHGRIATEKVTDHCTKTKHVLETVARLHEGLTSDTMLIVDGNLPEAPQLEVVN